MISLLFVKIRATSEAASGTEVVVLPYIIHTSLVLGIENAITKPFVLSEGVQCRSTCNKEAVDTVTARGVLGKCVAVRINDAEAEFAIVF